MARIAVYAGHGGSDSGAIGINGVREKNLNLQLSNAVSTILRGWGYTVFNNRTTDVDRSITRDAAFANENRVDAVVEIHFNSNSGTPGTGSEAFISVRDSERGGRARTLASAILNRLASLGFRNRGVFTSVNTNGVDTLGILRLTNMPAVLLETAFINNPDDMARFNLSNAATAIAEAIRQIFPMSGGNFPSYPGSPIRIGERSENVRQVQRCLNRVAANNPSVARLTEDGIFGAMTQASVMAFQRLSNLNPDGIIGPLTWAALTRECAASTGIMPPFPGTSLRIGSSGEFVRQIQRCMNRVAAREPAIGTLTEDGSFGQMTWCAVSTFQRLNNLNADGVVGPLTWAALTRECAA
ncbi:MAG: N-acetylmuramoyl-L-alanine amidase [Defluviitaleaceae bacterium]|nr:N-acetylmuramoyl-L-alanine amidase [Defluviitaleaceae bacterium]